MKRASDIIEDRPAAAVQRLSAAAHTDNVVRGQTTAAGTEALGNIGCGGVWSKNAERDMFAYARRYGDLHDIAPFWVKVPCREPGSMKPVVRRCPMLLPTDIVQYIYDRSQDEFRRRFGIGDNNQLLHYWDRMRSEPWFQDHPLRDQIERNPLQHVPVRLHGDDAEFSKRSKMLVLNMSGVLCQLQTILSRMLLVCFAMAFMLGAETFEPFYAVLAWNFADMSKSTHPETNHKGGNWKAKSRRARMAGIKICGGIHFIFTQLCGDWKFIKECLDIPSYCSGGFCFKCFATKTCGPLNAWRCSLEANWLYAPRSNATFLIHLATSNNPFLDIPGFHSGMIMADLMHVVLLGISHWLNGGSLWQMVWHENHFGTSPGPWKQAANTLLANAFKSFQTFCKDHRLTSSHALFTTSQLSMNTLGDNPFLKAKAANNLQIAKWLGHEAHLSHLNDPDNDHKKIRSIALASFVHIFAVSQGKLWLSDVDVVELERARYASLTAYKALCDHSLQENRNYFPMKPKCHLCDHAVRDSKRTRLSACSHWCFSDEDFIGRVKKLAQRCHLRSVSLRVLQRWSIRLWMTLRDAH